MKKNYLFLAIFIIFSTVTFSQIIEFQRSYDFGNGDMPNDILETPDGGLLIAGQTGNGEGNEIILVLKLNIMGDTLWTKTYAGDTTSFAQKIIQSSDGNYLIAGGFNGNSFLLKINSEGDSLWSMSFPGEHETAFKDLIELPNSNFALINWIYLLPLTSQVIIMDQENNIELVEDGIGDEFYTIQCCSDSEFLLSGWEGDIFDPIVFLSKYDFYGNLIFHEQFTEFEGQNRCMDISGESVFLGGFKQTNNGSMINSAMIKTDKEGNTEEWYDMPEELSWGITAIDSDNNDHIFACTSDYFQKTYINALNIEGQIIGALEIDIASPLISSCINIDNSLYVTGKYASDNNGWDIFLIKLNIDSLLVSTNEKDYPTASGPLVFPNPAKDMVFIEVPPGIIKKGIIIELWDNSGQKLNIPITDDGNIYAISTINMVKGIYYVSIYAPNRPVLTKKIVVVH